MPEPASLTVAEAVELDLGAMAPAERPYLLLNMVATADGRATIDGRSGPIGGATDRELFHELRAQVDAVMVGSGTLRAERCGRLVRDPGRRERRRQRGLEADPLAVVISGRLHLPADLPLLQDPESRVVIATAAEGEVAGARAHVEYVRAGGEGSGGPLALAPVLRRLRDDHGVRSILCEGGPHLNAALLAEGLVDEFFLTVAPKRGGGGAELPIVAGPSIDGPQELELVWLLEADGELFLRYRLPSR